MKLGNEDVKLYLGDSEVEKIYLGTEQVYGGEPTPVPYDEQYLTIESLENNNTIYLRASNTAITKTISASTDNGSTWTEYTSTNSGNGTAIATLNAGDTIIFKGENAVYATSTYYNFLKPTGQFNVYGNIMSLVSGDSFENADTLTGQYTFRNLFSGCTGLTSAENLILPTTTLTKSCYFGMFQGCTSLTTAPELPATTLAIDCYNSMFHNCTSLTTAPALSATTLANYCYANMLKYCSSLNYIKCLATNISANNCTKDWVNGVASTGTFVKAASMSDWTTGVNGIPTGWTKQNDDGSPVGDNWDDQE